MGKEILRELIIHMIRSNLEYAAVIWSHTRNIIRKLERKQRAATELVLSPTQLSFEKGLDKLKLRTFHELKERRNLIMMFKTATRLENMDREDLLTSDDGRTRGPVYKLKRLYN